MTISKFTPDELRNARKSGFKKKKPKLKRSGSYTSIVGSVERYNNWVKELKNAASKGRILENLKRQIASHRS